MVKTDSPTDTGPRTATLPRDGVAATTRDDAATYVALQRSAAFARLRSRSRRYLAAMTAFVLVMVFIAVWIPGSLALLFAVGLILLPPIVSAVHLRYAGRRLDPLAARIREEFESSRG